MNAHDEEQAQLIFNKAMADVDINLSAFRNDKSLVIGSCLHHGRYHDLIKMVYKEGYLAGMKFANNNKVRI